MVRSDKIEIADKDGSHLTYLDNFSDSVLSEQINGSYMFSFIAYVDSKLNKIVHENLVIVEGQKFEIARITKKRGDYPNILTECDHVSYKLNKADNTLGYDDTPASIVNQLLDLAAAKGFHFSVGTIEFSTPIYFKPGEKSVRECIIELAGVLGGEVIWDNYTVNIVNRRGSDKGLEFIVGENIREFSHEVDYTEEEPFTSIEIDIVDLSQLPDSEKQLKKIQGIDLGDSTRLVDTVLSIDETHRVVSYERDPFDKSLPKISIGNVPRLFTDYGERDEDKSENDEGNVYFRGEGILYVGPIESDEVEPVVYSFKVGSQNILEVENSEFTDEYLFGLELFHPDIFVEKSIIRTVVRISDQTLRAYNILVKNGNESYTNENFRGDTLTIIGTYPNDVELYIFEGEAIPDNIVKAYGASVIVEKNNDGDDEYREWMSKLTIAGENVLSEVGLNKTHEAQQGQIKSPPIVYVTSQWGDLVLEVPQDKMRDYFIRVSALNLINGRSIRTYNKNGFSGNSFTGQGWGPFDPDRETARYVIEFRTDNSKDGAGIVRAFSFNATLMLPDDLDEWPGSDQKPDLSEDQFFMEFGSAPFSTSMIYTFDNLDGYDSLQSVTHGVRGASGYSNPIIVTFDEIIKDGKVTGVKATSNWADLTNLPDLEISMQAVCKNNAKSPEVF